MLRGILIILLLTAGFLCPAARTAAPRNAPYSDLATGVSFPAELGPFRKTTVRISSNPIFGTHIQYVGGEGKCLATIFIYALSENPVPVTPEEFEQHIRTVRRTILEQTPSDETGRPNALQMKEVESQGQSRAEQGGTVIFREKFTANSDKEESYSMEVVLLRVGDRIVKLRLSVPSALTEAARDSEKFILAFCRLFCRGKDPVFEFKPRNNEAAAEKPEK